MVRAIVKKRNYFVPSTQRNPFKGGKVGKERSREKRSKHVKKRPRKKKKKQDDAQLEKEREILAVLRKSPMIRKTTRTRGKTNPQTHSTKQPTKRPKTVRGLVMKKPVVKPISEPKKLTEPREKRQSVRVDPTSETLPVPVTHNKYRIPLLLRKKTSLSTHTVTSTVTSTVASSARATTPSVPVARKKRALPISPSHQVPVTRSAPVIRKKEKKKTGASPPFTRRRRVNICKDPSVEDGVGGDNDVDDDVDNDVYNDKARVFTQSTLKLKKSARKKPISSSLSSTKARVKQKRQSSFKKKKSSPFPDVGAPDTFARPDPIVTDSGYWVLFPVPTKQLIRDIVNLSSLTPAPKVVAADEKGDVGLADIDEPTNQRDKHEELTSRLAELEEQHDTLSDEKAQLKRQLKAIADNSVTSSAFKERQTQGPQTRLSMVKHELEELETQIARHRQLCHFEDAQQQYYLNRRQELAERPALQHAQGEYERKAALVKYATDSATVLQKELNGTTKHAMEELGKAADIAGEDGVILPLDQCMTQESREHFKQMHAIRDDVLEKIADMTKLKLANNATIKGMRTVSRVLTHHVPKKKGAYKKSGMFTAKKRAERHKKARPYNKTGEHIKDFTNPRFPSQRDKRIADLTTVLGCAEDQVSTALVGAAANKKGGSK